MVRAEWPDGAFVIPEGEIREVAGPALVFSGPKQKEAQAVAKEIASRLQDALQDMLDNQEE